MISLVQLLNEVEGKPKAIILAGAPGAGKGYILKIRFRGFKNT
jgi:predicted ATPase